MANAFLFFLLLIISSNTIFENIHACKQSERSSLLSFALTLSSPQLNWTSNDCCNWEGITCDQDGSITHLQLPSRGLKLKEGIFLSSSLGNLTHLTNLNLSHNSLHGSLDQSSRFFLSLYKLEIVDLSYNLFSGELPFSLLSQNIQMLDLSSNHLHGAIPSSFFQQAWNLTSFNVSNNTFSGSIPSSICLHHSSPLIRLLDFSFNEFSGNISQGLGECSKLEVFRAGYNNLSGLLSDDIYNATTLEEIAFPHNSLYGAISERISNLTNLSILDLNTNGLTGMLPKSISKLSKLKLLLLQFNNLEGFLPPSLMNCTSLRELNMGFNNLEGNISELNFSRLTELSKLDLGWNHLTGMFPISLYSCKYLKAIRLTVNDIEGEIQPDILSLKFLSFLALGYNRLTNITKAMKILMHCKNLVVLSLSTNFIGEEFPADLGMSDFDGFQNLRLLAMGKCELTGQLPVWLSKLKKLEILALEFNRISGTIPSWMGTLPRLFYISLNNNRFSGEFPRELCKLPMLVSEHSQADDVYLELPIYGYQAPMTLVQYTFSFFPPAIYLDNNTINGNIPTEIGHLKLLHTLGLSNNNFSGNIPEELSNLKNLENLDVSMNHLSGKIPFSLTSLNFLSSLNVSYNNLEGEIPTSTQLLSFNPSAFEGNPKLCGPPLPNECLPLPNPKERTETVNSNNQHLLDINGQQIPWLSVVLGFIVGFFGISGSIFWKMYIVGY